MDKKKTELTSRLNLLDRECEIASRNIEKFKKQAKLKVEKILASDHTNSINGAFLHHLKDIDDYIYVVAEFNHLSEIYEKVADNTAEPPHGFGMPPKMEGAKYFKHPLESIDEIRNLMQEFDQIKISCKTLLFLQEPPLPLPMSLNFQQENSGFIMNINLPAVWIVAGDLGDYYELRMTMDSYYRHNYKVQVFDDKNITKPYWAMFDTNTNFWHRVLLLNKVDISTVQVLLVDTGEMKKVNQKFLKKLMPQFCQKPGFARYYYLPELNIAKESKDAVHNVNKIVSKYIGCYCVFKIVEHKSVPYGVKIKTEDGRILNDVIIKTGLLKHVRGRERVPNVTYGMACALPP